MIDDVDKKVIRLIQGDLPLDLRPFAVLAEKAGIGHDAQILAGVCEAGMIFVPSPDGVSHAPAERADWDDLEKRRELAAKGADQARRLADAAAVDDDFLLADEGPAVFQSNSS